MKDDKFSIIIGGIVTILVAGLFFAYFKSVRMDSSKIAETGAKTEVTENVYEIKKGDTLWKIAKKNYNDGYAWTKIYESNKSQIANPNKIEVGTKIILPNLENNIQEYIVVKGDSLWKIANSQCGNGYVWSSIARQNNLVRPEVIHTGNVLKFRCN